MHRSYKFRFYPTPEQAALLEQTFGCVRFIWNWALERRTAAYLAEGKQFTYVELNRDLTQLKADPDRAWLHQVSSVALQETLRHQERAFRNFFDRRANFPRFKSKKKSRKSATLTRSAFRFRDGQLWLAKTTTPLRVVWSRQLPSGVEPTNVTVSCDPAGRWHVAILVDVEIQPLPQLDTAVGVDVGLTSLATLSTGEKVTNPRHERVDRRKLAKAQRALSRKEAGSNNRKKARLRVARIHARITDRRQDHLHKLTTRLIRENQAIAVEDISVRNLVKNHALARAISDAGWHELRRLLTYKASWYGRDVLLVDRWFPSSKLCSACGKVAESLPLDIRSWACPCGTTHDRDVNAAKNILATGLAERLNACGDSVRPEPRKRGRRGSAKQEC